MLSLLYLLFFFFKQKTAYEMRISDWSSDVCSSDLAVRRHPRDAALPVLRRPARPLRRRPGRGARRRRDGHQPDRGAAAAWPAAVRAIRGNPAQARRAARPQPRAGQRRLAGRADAARRSEEHTSELQSLMRISYAV